MKKLILFASIFILILNSCGSAKKDSQSHENGKIDIDTTIVGKRFSGKIILSDYLLDDKKKPLSVELLYLKNNIPQYSDTKEIFKKKTYNFDFIISDKDLKKYTSISFTKGSYDTIFPIKLLKNTNNTVKLMLRKGIILKKPVIYLYPTKKGNVLIKHTFNGKILSTYPKYVDNWELTAYPDGHMYNHKDKRTYNYLFWEGKINFPNEHYNYDNGFVVTKDDIVAFLQQKLEKIGLNNTEVNDFITYWIPELSKHEFYFIHFNINDNIDQTSFMDVTPKPDTFIRLFMEFKGFDKIDRLKNMNKQTLPTIERKGFVFVEWGGAEIRKNINLLKNI